MRVVSDRQFWFTNTNSGLVSMFEMVFVVDKPIFLTNDRTIRVLSESNAVGFTTRIEQMGFQLINLSTDSGQPTCFTHSLYRPIDIVYPHRYAVWKKLFCFPASKNQIKNARQSVFRMYIRPGLLSPRLSPDYFHKQFTVRYLEL